MEEGAVESNSSANKNSEESKSSVRYKRNKYKSSSKSSSSSSDHDRRRYRKKHSRNHHKRRHRRSSSSDHRRHHKHRHRKHRNSSDSGSKRHRRRHHDRHQERQSKSSRDNRSSSKKKSIEKQKLTKNIEIGGKRPEDYEQGTMKIKQPVENKPTRAGGVYIPPWKMQKEIEKMVNSGKNTKEHQKYMWEQLRKSINGLINKVNVSNIRNIILELFNENLVRGRGLLAKAIFKAQMASPNFTHVYAALVAAINTQLPGVVKVLIARYVTQFQKSYKRNNKIV